MIILSLINFVAIIIMFMVRFMLWSYRDETTYEARNLRIVMTVITIICMVVSVIASIGIFVLALIA